MESLESTGVYKRWDDGFVVRRMTPDDARQVIKWYSDICPTSVDLQVALQIRDEANQGIGEGFFVADLNGKMVASKVEVSVCPGIRYGSLFYVEEQLRKFGYGRRINDVAMEVMDRETGSGIVCIDAHDELEAMNHRRGYETAFKVTQYEGKILESSGVDRRSNANVTLLSSDDDLSDIIHYDDKCFVKPDSEWRRQFLGRWTKLTGSRTVLARSQNGGVVGFGCRRPAVDVSGHQLIGPLYADCPLIARDIIAKLTSDVVGQTIWINIVEPNTDAVRLVEELRLSASLHMLRMNRNGNPPAPSAAVFAITSIDICGF